MVSFDPSTTSRPVAALDEEAPKDASVTVTRRPASLSDSWRRASCSAALLPLAFAIGQESAIQQPLALAIIAGLLIQFPMVLLAMPVLIGMTIGQPAPT